LNSLVNYMFLFWPELYGHKHLSSIRSAPGPRIASPGPNLAGGERDHKFPSSHASKTVFRGSPTGPLATISSRAGASMVCFAAGRPCPTLHFRTSPLASSLGQFTGAFRIKKLADCRERPVAECRKWIFEDLGKPREIVKLRGYTIWPTGARTVSPIFSTVSASSQNGKTGNKNTTRP
jgi:hypothetical protein